MRTPARSKPKRRRRQAAAWRRRGRWSSVTAAPVAAEAATQAEAVQDAGRPFVEKAVE